MTFKSILIFLIILLSISVGYGRNIIGPGLLLAPDTSSDYVYASQAIAEEAGLVYYWKMDESGNTVADSTTNGYDLTQTNTTIEAGKIGNARVFNTSDFLQNTNACTNAFTNMTVCFWWKGETSTVQQRIMDICGVNDNAIMITGNSAYGSIPAYNLSYMDWVTENLAHIAWDSNWNDTWVLFTMTWEGTTGILYVNGDTVAWTESVTARPESTWDAGITIGSAYDESKDDCEGSIDEVSLFNTTLTQATIQDIYNSGTGKALFQ